MRKRIKFQWADLTKVAAFFGCFPNEQTGFPLREYLLASGQWENDRGTGVWYFTPKPKRKRRA